MKTPQERNYPTVTVVMPIRNEATFIERSLGSVLAQDYPSERMEILVADGMSDDATVDIIRRMDGAERVRVMVNPGRLQSEGLNLLIAEASGDYIIRVDGHTILAPDYITNCVSTLQETGADNVGGNMQPFGITPMGHAIACAGRSVFGVPTAFHTSTVPQYTDTVYLGAWPREVFERIGGFRAEYVPNEDYELNVRIAETGGRIYLNPAIQSKYYGRQSLRDLWRQYYRYGRGKVQTLRSHPDSLRPRQTIAPLFVLGLLGGLPLGILLRPLRWLYVSVLALYVLLAWVFALREIRRYPEMATALRVVAAFAVMHIAWGLGFWRQLLRPEPIR